MLVGYMCQSTDPKTIGEKGATTGQRPLPFGSDDNPLHPGGSFVSDSLPIKIITVRELGGVPSRSMNGLASEEKGS